MTSTGIQGSPAELFSAANQFAATAQHLNEQRNQILNASNQATSNWQSQGAFAFTGASNWLQASVTNAGQGFEQAATATRRYGTALQTAQDGWNKCNQELHKLQSELQTVTAQLHAAENTNAQRATANMAAAVFTPFPNVSLGGVSLGGSTAAAPTQLPMIPIQPIQDHIHQLNLDIKSWQTKMCTFEADAEQAAHSYAGTLGTAQSKGGSGGILGVLSSAFNSDVQVLSGIGSAVASAGGQFAQGAGGFFSGIGNSLGNQLYGAYEAIIHGRYEQWKFEQQVQSAKQTDYAIHNPGAVANAMFDMNDFSHGRYFRWGGHIWALGLTTFAPVGGVAADGLRADAAANNAAAWEQMAQVGYAQGYFGVGKAGANFVKIPTEPTLLAKLRAASSFHVPPDSAQLALIDRSPFHERQIKAGTFQMSYTDGSHAAYKPAGGESDMRPSVTQGAHYRGEVSAYITDKHLGFDVVPTTAAVHGSHGIGSLQDWAAKPGQFDVSAYHHIDQQKMGAFDYITGNTDRHLQNVMSQANGRPAAIDHGLAFPTSTQVPLRSVFFQSILHQPLDPSIVQSLSHVNATALAHDLANAGLSQSAIDGTVARLQEAQTGTITGSAWGGKLSDGDWNTLVGGK